ncbi:hypothetical protein [Bradyrhizobium sp. MOS003]|jgi:hypothetical protein|uniref:hypothetical protein n=1 Tax=Bradyrhizobium sp. MOS003 TaxID=2133946 RepID=UPI000D12C45D|nr:hypothetical protein [Bradyrhizobium sp. MOS003]PSO17786.1 hypothetical protein C7G42_15305 [Bradyrhizobium sp. MOS003]
MVGLDQYFGTHTGNLKIYVGLFKVGSGSFTSFNSNLAAFSGSYSAFGSSGTFTIEVQLLHVQNASSGTCKVTLNDKTDASAAYTVAGNKFSLQTNLNPTPIDIYVSQGGTQFDGVSGHNLWIGQWS